MSDNVSISKEDYDRLMKSSAVKESGKLFGAIKGFGGRLVEAGRLLSEESGTKESLNAKRSKLALFIAPKKQ